MIVSNLEFDFYISLWKSDIKKYCARLVSGYLFHQNIKKQND